MATINESSITRALAKRGNETTVSSTHFNFRRVDETSSHRPFTFASCGSSLNKFSIYENHR